MRLHPASLLVGVGLTVAAFVLSSAAPQTTLNITPGVVHHDIAHPRNFVEVKEGTPFTVPSARLFVVTNVGTNWSFSQAELKVNGALVLRTEPSTADFYVSCADIGRYVCQPGDTVEVVGNNEGRAWGFLTDL